MYLAADRPTDRRRQPNGSALAASQRRFTNISAELLQQNITQPPGPLFIPRMPDSANAWVNGRLNSRPLFIGCSANPTPSERDMSAPLIISVPNVPVSAYSNVSTFDLELSQNETDAIFFNGIRTLTLNGTLAGNWSSALACALADRAVFRAGNNRSRLCTDLFKTWCWDGSANATNVTEPYAPVLGSVSPFLAGLGVSPSPAAGYEANATATALGRRRV
jgi:lysophospholipase